MENATPECGMPHDMGQIVNARTVTRIPEQGWGFPSRGGYGLW